MNIPYFSQIKDIIALFDSTRDNRYFVFGSAVRSDIFHDIDLAVEGNKQSKKKIETLRELFYDASIPYKVDVVDMDSADSDFREYVLEKEKKIWI